MKCNLYLGLYSKPLGSTEVFLRIDMTTLSLHVGVPDLELATQNRHQVCRLRYPALLGRRLEKRHKDLLELLMTPMCEKYYIDLLF